MHTCIRWVCLTAITLGYQAELPAQSGSSPPTITYGASRKSTAWLDVGGTKAAVDDGIEWQDRKAYLTLTFDLVVIDASTKKTLWSHPVGAFWNTITFINLSKPAEKPRWVVELSSTSQPTYRQQFDLNSGKKLDLIGGPPMPQGKTFMPRKVWSGSAGSSDDKNYLLVTSSAQWNQLRAALFPPAEKNLPTGNDVDFTTEVLLLCYAGKATNWNGFSVELAVENDHRLLLRLQRSTYQTLGKGKSEHPYGLIVLPRKAGKEYILEYNRQNLIGGPPLWKEFMRLSLKHE